MGCTESVPADTNDADPKTADAGARKATGGSAGSSGSMKAPLKLAFVASQTEDPMMKAFRKVDTDSSGTISFKEFAEAVQDVGLMWDPDKLKRTFKEMDEDKNKQLDFQEFKAAIKKLNAAAADQSLAEDGPSFAKSSSNADLPDAINDLWTRLKAGKTGGISEDDITGIKCVQLTIEECAELLKTKDTPWKERNNALHQVAKHVIDDAMDSAKFTEVMDLMIGPICTQLTERRSAVAIEACVLVGNICNGRKELFGAGELTPYATRIIEALLPGIRMAAIAAICQNTAKCACALVANVDDDEERSILNCVVTNCGDKKYKETRTGMLDCLNELLKKAGLAGRLDDEVWAAASKCVTNGVQDKDKNARDAAVECFKTINQYRSEQADDIAGDLPKRSQNLVNESRGIVVKRVRTRITKARSRDVYAKG